MMKFIGIIPARYASTRFPGKPLADMNGKPMIQRVYEQVKDVLDSVCVATDDIRIENAVKAFGGQVVMTSDQHRSGTDRCYEAYQKIGEGYDVIVNIQGDEPFIHPEQIQTIKTCFADANTQIATLVKPFRSDDDLRVPYSIPIPRKSYSTKTTRHVFQSIHYSLYPGQEIYGMVAESYLLQTYRVICLSCASAERNHPITSIRFRTGGKP